MKDVRGDVPVRGIAVVAATAVLAQLGPEAASVSHARHGVRIDGGQQQYHNVEGDETDQDDPDAARTAAPGGHARVWQVLALSTTDDLGAVLRMPGKKHPVAAVGPHP